MKKIHLFLMLLPALIFGQNSDRNFSFELKGNTISGIGENYVADATKPFFGFGMGISGLVYKNFGLGMEYNKEYSEVTDVSIFGDLRNPAITTVDFHALYRHPFTEKFELEGQVGGGFYEMRSNSRFSRKKFIESGSNFLIGTKVLYGINSLNNIFVFGGAKLYFINAAVEIDNEEKNRYYSEPTLLNFNLGLRFYF